jgi:hypothetical protein
MIILGVHIILSRDLLYAGFGLVIRFIYPLTRDMTKLH